MNRVLITGAVISKGYDDQPAFRYNEARDAVRFKIGYKVYDKQATDNHRWINLTVKAFKSLIERIEKMDLKEGSYINVLGRLDEDVWNDNGVTKRIPVIMLDEIEFSGGNGNGSKKQESQNTADHAGTPVASSAGDIVEGGGFDGFSSVSSQNDLY